MWLSTMMCLAAAAVTLAEHYPHQPHTHSHPYHHHHHTHPHHHHTMGHSHRNQRIIKVNHQQLYHKHHKPWGGPPPQMLHSQHPQHPQHPPHYHEADHYEYVRPRQPSPPYYAGPNHVKHHPRPPPHYKAPTFSSGYPHKPPASNSFRPPAIKDHFRTPTLPSHTPSFEYLPSKPLSPLHSASHPLSSDDNRGPIHEIPAPNLAPLAPKPQLEVDTSEEVAQGFDKAVDFSSFPKESVVTIAPDHGPSYEVTEKTVPTNDHVLEGADGSKAFYAPDPDPSLPVYKVPPTLDPYSTPSNGQSEVYHQDFQILDGGSLPAPVNALSSQDLFELMHGFQRDEFHQQMQPPLVTVLAQPTVIVTPQPELMPHQPQHFSHPQFQSFNYVENNPYAGAVPMEDYQHLQQPSYEPDASESEQQSEEKPLEDIAENQIEDFERGISQTQDKSPIFEMKAQPEVPFYTSLPNRQTAEAFATLQAAGSIASNYINTIQTLRGDQQPEEEQQDFLDVAQGHVRQLGLTEEQLLKPQKVNYVPEVEKTEAVEVQKSIPVFETSYLSQGLVDPESDRREVRMEKESTPTPVQLLEEGRPDTALLANLDFGQGAASEKFGRRIRPK